MAKACPEYDQDMPWACPMHGQGISKVSLLWLWLWPLCMCIFWTLTYTAHSVLCLLHHQQLCSLMKINVLMQKFVTQQACQILRNGPPLSLLNSASNTYSPWTLLDCWDHSRLQRNHLRFQGKLGILASQDVIVLNTKLLCHLFSSTHDPLFTTTIIFE